MQVLALRKLTNQTVQEFVPIRCILNSAIGMLFSDEQKRKENGFMPRKSVSHIVMVSLSSLVNVDLTVFIGFVNCHENGFNVQQEKREYMFYISKRKSKITKFKSKDKTNGRTSVYRERVSIF